MASNAIATQLRKYYASAAEYMKKAKVSVKNWSATGHVFGFHSEDKSSEVIDAKFIEFPERIYLPPILRCMYDILGAKDREFYFGAWAFSSINNMEKIHSRLIQCGQNNLLQAATKYAGMGWQIAIFLDKNTGKFFLLNVGGSNGYDRQASAKQFLEYDQKTSNHSTYNFKELMENVLNNDDFGPSECASDETLEEVIVDINASRQSGEDSSIGNAVLDEKIPLSYA